jgi:flagellar hook assembly protein FlgD
VAFSLPSAAHVRLGIYDLTGKQVATLMDGERPAGRSEATWDGRDHGGRAAAGIYFVRLETPAGTRLTRVVLIR